MKHFARNGIICFILGLFLFFFVLLDILFIPILPRNLPGWSICTFFSLIGILGIVLVLAGVLLYGTAIYKTIKESNELGEGQ